MGSFGERLRREREMRGVSLDDIAEATKIGTRSLRALEDEHFEVLPGGIFNKGFVRAYAKYLGLNEDEMVADYLQAAGESGPDPRLIAEQNSSRIDRGDGDFGGAQRPGFPIVPVLILLVVVAAGIGGWRIYQDRMRERQARLDAAKAAAVTQPAITTSPANAPNAGAEPPTGTTTASQAGTGVSTQAVPPSANTRLPAQPSPAVNTPPTSGAATLPATTGAATPQPIEVIVKPKDKAWVSIKSDGKFTVRGVIGPPDVKTIHAVGQVVFWTGNAGAIDLTVNGQPVIIQGGLNEVAVLVITPKGVEPAKPASANHAAQ
jgi:cytoskeleton protein RodZ